VLAAVWPEAASPRGPRRSSRLAFALPDSYLSIVDRAVLRRKELDEGKPAAAPSCRRGELPSEDLVQVAVEDGQPLLDADVEALAVACDIPIAELALDTPLPASSSASP
jgi:hypothetical protein